MATINFSSPDIKYVTKFFSKTKINSNASGTGTTRQEALTAAENNAKNQISNADWVSGSSNTGNSSIGRRKDDVSITEVTNINFMLMDDDEWRCALTYSGNQYGRLYQTHLKFTIPSGVAADNIKSVILKITTTSNSNINICVCGPKNSTTISDEVYYNYNADALYYGDTYYTTNNKTTIELDIKNQFIKCIDNNQGVLVVTPYQTDPGSRSTAYISNLNFSIIYELNTTKCTAPTSIQDNGTNFIVPGGAIKLKWSGAQAGTNNAIAGYRIYWGKNSSFVPGSGVIGYYDFNSTNTNCSFTSATGGNMPFSSADFSRGDTCYFKICTKGSVKVNDKWYSDISSTTCSIVLNNLPESPTINNISGTNQKSRPSRIKSEGTTLVEFNVTPGNTNNTGQIGSVYYLLPGESEKHPFNGTINLTRPSTGNTISVYFFTYDGYEFSSNSNYSVPINTAPTCSITSLTINNGNDNYYNPYISAKQTQETYYTGGSITKSWEIISNGVSTQVSDNNIINYYLLDNNGVTFGSNCIIKYMVTDDIGETASAQEIFSFSDVPTYSFISGVHNNLFGTNLGIEFSENIKSNKLNLIFSYKLNTDNNWNDNYRINIIKDSSYTTMGTINCSELTRGVQYCFKIIFSLSNGNFKEIEYKENNTYIIMQRAPDITPTNGTTLIITPFTPSTATFQFKCNGITNLNQLNDKNIKFKFSTNELVPTSISYSISSNIITASLTYDTITSSSWSTFINSQLNKIYNGKIQVSVEDLCNDSFTNEFDIHYDFSNSLDASNNLSGSLQIKCDNNNYISLSDNNYPLFENQILRINLSNLKSYCNETIHFILYDHADSTRNYNITTTIQLNHSNGNTTRPVYTSGTNDYIEFIIPKILVENSQQNITYFTLDIINEANQTDEKQSINIYSSEKIKLCRCNIDAINFVITKIEENNDYFKFYYTVTDFGGSGEEPCTDNYKLINGNRAVYAKFYYSDDGINYNDYFTLTQITSNPIEISSPSGVNFGEKVFFKTEIKVINNFQTIGSAIPIGIDYHIRSYENSQEFIFYNSIPNLAYGKNFFLINTTDVDNLNEDDYVLVIRPINYIKNNQTITRRKIYFGEKGEETCMEITQNGLIISGGTWNI